MPNIRYSLILPYSARYQIHDYEVRQKVALVMVRNDLPNPVLMAAGVSLRFNC
jgi:hypothetical protein